jgi:ferredoxin
VKYAVDLHQCQNLGQCTVSAPNVFSFDDSGQLSLRTQADDEYVSAELAEGDAAEASVAADMCPMQAISLRG